MTIANKWYGAVTSASNAPQPVAGGSFNAGDALLFWTWENPGADTVTASAGSALDFNTNAKQVRCFGFISATGAESMPIFTWSGGTSGRAVAVCYSGVDSGFATGGNASDRASNTTQDIVMPAVTRTPSVPGCLCLYYGIHKKSSTSDGTTFSAPGGTGFSTPIESVPNGNAAAFVLGEWIQTTATTIASGITFSGSIADASSTMQSALVILKPALAAAIPYPPTSLGGMNVQVCQ